MAIQGKSQLQHKGNRAKFSRYIFCITMAAIPVLQFILMFLGARIQSFALAFQHYENAESGIGYDITFAGFDNFVKAFEKFGKEAFMFKNSLILLVCTMLIGTTLALIFSFYIYKQYSCSGLFKTVLFMPQIISGLIFATIFRYLATDGYIFLMEKFTGKEVLGLLDSADTRFATLVFFNIWVSFGVNVLLYSGAMSGINESVVESARLDGVNVVQEFIHITLPLIYPTIVTFIVINLSGVFTNIYAVLDLVGVSAKEIANVGSWFYTVSLKGDYVEEFNTISLSILSACGLILTAIVMPVVIIIKNLLEKFGPSVD